MSSRRRPPADLASVKKSRASFTGAVTKALDKLKAIKFAEPADILLINTKEVDRILSSLERTEAGFLVMLEDAQNFIPEGEAEEAFLLEEDTAMESFHSSISAARDLSDQLLTLKSVLNGLSNFSCDLSALQDSLVDKPESNQSSALQSLENLFSSLREQWQGANLTLSNQSWTPAGRF